MTDQHATSTRPQVDPRGQRFNAAVTAVVLAIGLITAVPEILLFQAVVFALGAFVGLQYSPYGWIFRRFVRPRIGPPAELEDAAPPRFAQAVGFVFATVATVGYFVGADLVGTVATALALAAAFLNAAFGFCLGCEMYLLVRRITKRSTAHPTKKPAAEAASKEVSA